MRVNPATQEVAPIDAPAAAVIGLKSALLLAGQLRSMNGAATRLPRSDDGQELHVQDERLGLSFNAPDWLTVWNTPATDSLVANAVSIQAASTLHLVLSNLRFNDAFGFASLQRSDFYLVITRSDLVQWQVLLHHIPGNDLLNPIPAGFTVAGSPAYWLIRPDSGAFLKTIAVTTPDSLYTFDWYSLAPDTDTLMMSLLASVKITP